MKLGQIVTKPKHEEIKQKYESILYRINEISNSDCKLYHFMIDTLLYIEWYFMFLDKINEEYNRSLKLAKQKEYYANYLNDVKSTHTLMKKYYTNNPQLDLPDDIGNQLDAMRDALDNYTTNMISEAIVDLIKNHFGIDRIRVNQDRKKLKNFINISHNSKFFLYPKNLKV